MATATETASPSAATPVVAPAPPRATPQSASAEVALPPELPRIQGEVEAASRDRDGAITVTWLVSAAPDEVVAALADAIAASLDLLLDERAPGGGVLAFEGAAVAGHYLVTTAGSETRVELRLDPPPPAAVSPPVAVDLPDGYPGDAVPIFPGATVVSVSTQALDDGRVRYVLVFVTARQPVELLGFYRDLLATAGWLVFVREADLDASAARGAVSLTVTAGALTEAVLLVDWAP